MFAVWRTYRLDPLTWLCHLLIGWAVHSTMHPELDRTLSATLIVMAALGWVTWLRALSATSRAKRYRGGVLSRGQMLYLMLMVSAHGALMFTMLLPVTTGYAPPSTAQAVIGTGSALTLVASSLLRALPVRSLAIDGNSF